MPTYLTPREVAERLQRSGERIAEMLAFGELPSVQVPWDGVVIPIGAIPPFQKVSEEEG